MGCRLGLTRELEEESHIRLKALSERLKKDDIRDLLEGVNRSTEKVDKELADSVLEVSIGANKQIIKESDEAELVFLNDMNSFDHDNFNLEWLTRCAGGFQ